MHFVISFYYEEFVYVCTLLTYAKIGKHTYGRTKCNLYLLVVIYMNNWVYFSKALIFTCNGTSDIKKRKSR